MKWSLLCVVSCGLAPQGALPELDRSDPEQGSGDTARPEVPAPQNPEAVLFEEGFEAAGLDSVPAGWDTFVAWQANTASNQRGDAAFALVDGVRAHSGAQALYAKGGSLPAQIAHPLPDGTDRVYVRAWVWSSVQLGSSPGRNHETLIALRTGSGTVSDEVRFGEIKGVIGTNEVPSDDISPTQPQWGAGPVIAAEGWRCVEVAFLADRVPHEVRAWSDGLLVHEITDASQWNNRVLGDTFLTGKFGEVVIGWHSFSQLDADVWFDDVVVASDRVGC